MATFDGFNPALSNMGSVVALSKLGITPVSDDIIGDLESLSGLSITANNVDSTPVSSANGMSRLTPTYKAWGNSTVTVYKNNDNFKKVFNQFFGYNTSEPGFYCDLTIQWPKLPEWTDVYDITLHGYVSGFSWSDITRDDIQKFTFNFQPSGQPVLFAGFSKITNITANPTTIDAAGGSVTFTVTGTDLIDNLLVKGFVDGTPDPLTIGYTSGTSTSQTVIVKLPPNTSSDDKVYTFQVSADGGITYSSSTVEVTVSATAG